MDPGRGRHLPAQPGQGTRGATRPIADVECSPPRDRDADLPETFVDYEENPREYFAQRGHHRPRRADPRLGPLQQPYDQIQEQLRLIIEKVKERQESELINNTDYGLLDNVRRRCSITTRTGAPTPDDLDELIAKVWKEPAFFLAHPRAIAAFGRECTRRGVPPPTVTLFGSPFLTWRGLPLVPSDKLPLDERRARPRSCCCAPARRSRASSACSSRACPGEVSARACRCASWASTSKAIASYLISLYCSLAVLTEDALGVLEDVEVGKYHDYPAASDLDGGAAALRRAASPARAS